MAKIFVLSKQDIYGPYTIDVLREHVRAGNFSTSTLCSSDGGDWVSIEELPDYRVSLPAPPAKIDDVDFTYRGFMLGDVAESRIKTLAIYGAFIGFICHLILWLSHSRKWIHLEGDSVNLLHSPFSALYTPFSILLAYEAYQLIREIPTSFSNSVGKQFEIVTLLVVRDIFKGLSHINLTDEWSLDVDLKLLLFECFAFLVLFYTSMNYRKCNISLMLSTMEIDVLKTYVKSKRFIAQLLLITYFLIALLAFGGWLMGLLNGEGDADRKIFFLDFFTVLILADILILLIFYKYSDDFYALARNTGFVLATVILRVAIGASGLSAIILFIASGVLGIAILRISLHFYNASSSLRKFSTRKIS